MSAETDYLNLLHRIENYGEWIYNERTGKNVLTAISHNASYDVANNEFPLITTRQAPWKSALKEIIGYICGYRNAADFRELGVNTWNANANDNAAWLNNPNRLGEDDMGDACYRMRPKGYVPIKHRKETDSLEVKASYEGEGRDMLRYTYEMLLKREDDRGLIINMWNPDDFDQSCLRPCMYKHHFSLLGDKLYLDSEQRSNDVLLGNVFNMVQCFGFLAIMAHITKLKGVTANHKSVNCHIYEDQYKVFKESGHGLRKPFPAPRLIISDELTSLEQLETITPELFEKWFQLEGYECHPAIKYPFSV